MQSTIKFFDDTLVPRDHKAKYLGTFLSDKAESKQELTNRMVDALTACKKMKIFWEKADTTIKWKLQVYGAIVRSKLLYGLEAIQPTNSEQKRLNAFQMRFEDNYKSPLDL